VRVRVRVSEQHTHTLAKIERVREQTEGEQQSFAVDGLIVGEGGDDAVERELQRLVRVGQLGEHAPQLTIAQTTYNV